MIGGLLGHGQGIGVVILAVGDQHDHLLAGAIVVETGHGGADGIADVGPRFGDHLRSGVIQKGAGRSVVRGKGKLNEAGP